MAHTVFSYFKVSFQDFPEYVSAQTTPAAKHFQTSSLKPRHPRDKSFRTHKTCSFARTRSTKVATDNKRSHVVRFQGGTAHLTREEEAKTNGVPRSKLSFIYANQIRPDSVSRSRIAVGSAVQLPLGWVLWPEASVAMRFSLSLRLVVRVLFLSAQESRETFQVGGGWFAPSYVGCSIWHSFPEFSTPSWPVFVCEYVIFSTSVIQLNQIELFFCRS